jgi:hypothetical protein
MAGLMLLAAALLAVAILQAPNLVGPIPVSTASGCALADVGGLLRCHAWTGVSPAQPGGSRAVLPWLALPSLLCGLWLTSSYYLP